MFHISVSLGERDRGISVQKRGRKGEKEKGSKDLHPARSLSTAGMARLEHGTLIWVSIKSVQVKTLYASLLHFDG
jgi:hypothetical protein